MSVTQQPARVLELEAHGSILIATLNRPLKGNALSTELITSIGELVDQLKDGEHRHIQAVVITGSGTKVFSAGADISNLDGLTRDQARDQMLHGQAIFTALEDLNQVVIAAINGIAYGGGLELAMACDIRVAGPNVLLGQPEITLANLPGWAGTQRLPRLIGEGRALEMILTGDPIGAERAYEIGLINSIAEDPVDTAVKLAERITLHAAGAVAAAKQAVYDGMRNGISHGSELEAELVGDRCVTEEQRDAVTAFLNRKKKHKSQESK